MVTLIVGDAKRLQISWHHPIDIYRILVNKYIDIKKYSYRNILIRARSIGSNNPDRDSMLLIVSPPILSTLLRPSESRIIPLMSVVRSVILSIFLRPFYVTYPSTVYRRSHFKPLPRDIFHRRKRVQKFLSKTKKIDRATIPLSLHQKRGREKKRGLTRQPSLDKLDERSETSCHYCRWNAVSRGYLRNRPLKHAEAAFRSFLSSS